MYRGMVTARGGCSRLLHFDYRARLPLAGYSAVEILQVYAPSLVGRYGGSVFVLENHIDQIPGGIVHGVGHLARSLEADPVFFLIEVHLVKNARLVCGADDISGFYEVLFAAAVFQEDARGSPVVDAIVQRVVVEGVFHQEVFYGLAFRILLEPILDNQGIFPVDLDEFLGGGKALAEAFIFLDEVEDLLFDLFGNLVFHELSFFSSMSYIGSRLENVKPT